MTISACNVGSSIVGTGEEAYGEYFKREDALRACASGYHLPSVDERQIMVAGLRRENPSYTSRK
ncbi:MAG: hypothetical protein LBO09_01695 [Candidatus Peribacteria bacterium]|jgi:hypothetical protein|nr:hypothetical protein [Candidatus Peribacteria bacterium]